MKALTVLQPWAWAIASGHKRIENRTWPTSHRGPLAIHAGKSRSWLSREDAAEWPDRYGVAFPSKQDMVFGAIIAVVRVVDCVPLAAVPHGLAAWASGPWCWLLDGVQRIKPIECPGALSLWTPPDHITPSILAASGFDTPT